MYVCDKLPLIDMAIYFLGTIIQNKNQKLYVNLKPKAGKSDKDISFILIFNAVKIILKYKLELF